MKSFLTVLDPVISFTSSLWFTPTSLAPATPLRRGVCIDFHPSRDQSDKPGVSMVPCSVCCAIVSTLIHAFLIAFQFLRAFKVTFGLSRRALVS